MFKKIIVCILILALILATMTACQNDNNKNVDSEKGLGKFFQEEASEKIYIPMSNVKTLNPAISTDEDTYYISKLIYDSLFELDDNLIPKENLVSRYNYTNDNKTLELEIKKGIKWHNGKNLTGDDIKFSIEVYKAMEKVNVGLYGDYVSNIKSVSADGNSVTINYYSDIDNNIVNLIFPILPSSEYRSAAEFAKKGADNDFIPIGTGCYKVTSYDELSQLVLEANPNYHNEVATNTLIFNVLPNKKTAVNLLSSGDLSLLHGRSVDRDTLIADNDIKETTYLSNEIEFIGFNMLKDESINKYIRQAVIYAIDAEKILEKAYYNKGVISNSIFYPGYFNIGNEENKSLYNISKAKNTLKTIGYEDRNKDGYVENRDNEILTINLLVNSDNNSRVMASEQIKEALKKVGILVVIDLQPQNLYISKLYDKNYDTFIGSAIINERCDFRPILHSSYNNIVSYSNKKVDKYLERMASSVTNDEKAKLAKAIEKEVQKDMPYYCMFYKTYGIYHLENLEGNINPLFNNAYRGCGNWMYKFEKSY